MKATDNFKVTIKACLDQRAESDILFSFKYSAPKKNMNDCCLWIAIHNIYSTVAKSLEECHKRLDEWLAKKQERNQYGRRITTRYFFHDLPNERGEKVNKKPEYK